ncbi:MAG TPA: hypothetical protein VIL16_22450 [Trebonia sp.]
MSADGHEFFRAANGVWLTEHVPHAFISLKDRPSTPETRATP